MPELVKADRKNYSFTTLSADLNINLDIAEQEYSIENIDGAVGGAIAKALEGITGTEIYKKSDAIQILEPLQISLHLKLRAEINLKDNKKTRAVIELNGKIRKATIGPISVFTTSARTTRFMPICPDSAAAKR